MLRAPAALSLLAVLAAGCGGASLQSTARVQAGKWLGDPDAHAVRIETVRLVDGDRAAVAQMQGHFTFVPSCPAVVGHARSRCHPFHTRFAVLEIDLSRTDFGGFWTFSPAERAAVATARQSSPLFRVFPDFTNEVVLCGIPLDAGLMTLAGTCMTELVGSQKRVRQIRFVEHWPVQGRRERVGGGWIVALGPSGRVLGTRVTGRTPPQLWK